jgi:hypothetical protein
MIRGRAHRLIAFAPLCLLTSFGLSFFSRTVCDPYLWGHVRFGQDILRTGRIIQRDPYSYRTGDQLWINHEWLSEVFFAALYDRAGAAGLISFKVLVSLLILWLGYSHLRACRLSPYPSVLWLALVSLPLQMGLGTVRPHMFTYLCFLILLLLLARAGTARPRWLWLMPIVFAFWVNVHGGVLAGAGVLCLWMIGLWIDRALRGGMPGKSSLRLIATVGAPALTAVLALLVNPYGAGLIRFLVRTATVPRPDISEWTALGLLSAPGLVYLGLVALGLAALVLSRRDRSASGLLVMTATAVMTAISNRHFPLFALALVVVGGEHVADLWNLAAPAEWSRLAQSAWTAGVSLVVSLVLVGSAVPRFGCIPLEASYFAFPARVVEHLRQSGARGNLAVAYDWGEYALWHLGPALKVSIDGRRETVYSDTSYRQSVEFARGTGDWTALLRDGRTDLVLVPKAAPAAGSLSQMDGWVALYGDTFCVLFARAGFPGLEQILATPVPEVPDNGDGLCFPGPGVAPRRADRIPK